MVSGTSIGCIRRSNDTCTNSRSDIPNYRYILPNKFSSLGGSLPGSTRVGSQHELRSPHHLRRHSSYTPDLRERRLCVLTFDGLALLADLGRVRVLAPRTGAFRGEAWPQKQKQSKHARHENEGQLEPYSCASEGCLTFSYTPVRGQSRNQPQRPRCRLPPTPNS